MLEVEVQMEVLKERIKVMRKPDEETLALKAVKNM